MEPRNPTPAPAPERGSSAAWWVALLALLVALAALAVAVAGMDGPSAAPGEVVTPSPYGWPSAGALLLVPWMWPAWVRARLARAVRDPQPDGHNCDYCVMPARLAFRRQYPGRPDWLVLLTERTAYACWDHYSYAVGSLVRSSDPR